MPQPTLSQARWDPLLTNFLVAYTNERRNFVHSTLYPVIPVRQPAGSYKKVKKGEFFKDRVRERPMGGAPDYVGFEMEDDTYSVKEEALGAKLDDRERANQTMPPIDLEKLKVQMVVDEHLVHLDRKFGDIFFKAGAGWTTEVDGTSITRWDAASSTPIKDVRGWSKTIQLLGVPPPNRLLLGRTVYDALLDNADLLGRMTGAASPTSLANVTVEHLRQLFFPEDPSARVVVANAIYNTASSGATASLSYILNDKAALLCYAAPAAAIGIVTAGATFSWTGLLPNAGPFAPGQAPGVWRGRDDEAYSDWFHVRMASDFKMVAPDAGLFAYDIVS